MKLRKEVAHNAQSDSLLNIGTSDSRESLWSGAGGVVPSFYGKF